MSTHKSDPALFLVSLQLSSLFHLINGPKWYYVVAKVPNALIEKNAFDTF